MKMLLFFLIAFVFYDSHAANKYFSSSTGNDLTGDGTISAPYASIAKFNALAFAAGDSALFKRGDTFYGAMIINNSGNSTSPIVIGAYSSGARPTFSVLSTVSGWGNVSGNIWQASVASVKNNVNLVLKDGAIKQVGRYPNTDAANGGYLTISSGTRGAIGATSTLVGSALSTTTDWTNAELVIKIRHWDIQRQKVTAHSGGTLSYTEEFGEFAPSAGFGYFFQRDPRTLDQDGEWYYDTTASKLQMYFSDNTPTAHAVTVSTVDTLIFASSKNYITVRDIRFVGANQAAIWHQFTTGFKIINCDFRTMGKEAAVGWFSTISIIDSCTAKNCLSAGFYLRNTSAGNQIQSITNCTADSTDMFAGMEKSGDAAPRGGISVYADSSVIAFNKVTNSGYNAIEWLGSNFHINNNYVDSFASVRDDAGGIYTYEGMASGKVGTRINRSIIKNVVLHGIGNFTGVPANTSSFASKGIYLDEGTRNVFVDSNTVAYITGSGIYSTSCDSITVTNNTDFQCSYAFSFNRFSDAPTVRSIIVKKNIFYPYHFSASNSAIDNPTLLTRDADIAAMGTIDSNYYNVNSRDTSLISTTSYTDGSHFTASYASFPYLQSTIGIERASISLPSNGILKYNSTNSPLTVDLSNYSYYNMQTGQRYFYSLVIPPYSSVIINYPNLLYESSIKVYGKIKFFLTR